MAFVLSACEERTINRILAEPGRYSNREVGVRGTVVQSYSVLGRGAYQVDDGTGKLWVVSDKGVPRKGSRVGVRGHIRDGFDLGSLVKLPEAVSHGVVMIENEHRATYKN
jgi:hypothetical protein